MNGVIATGQGNGAEWAKGARLGPKKRGEKLTENVENVGTHGAEMPFCSR